MLFHYHHSTHITLILIAMHVQTCTVSEHIKIYCSVHVSFLWSYIRYIQGCTAGSLGQLGHCQSPSQPWHSVGAVAQLPARVAAVELDQHHQVRHHCVHHLHGEKVLKPYCFVI